MLYIIDDLIYFRPDDGLLWLKNDDTSTTELGMTASRLFHYIVENRHEVLERERILQNVWDEHGLVSSNTSLNQHISIIRRKLKSLGAVNDIIITQPKVGFRIEHVEEFEIDLTENKDNESNSFIFVEDKPPKKGRRIYPFTALFTKGNKKLTLSIYGVTLIWIIFLFYAFLNHRHSDFTSISDLYLLGKINDCKVYSFNKNSDEIKAKKLKMSSLAAEKNKIACQSPSDIYIVNISDNLAYGRQGEFYMTRCNINNDNLITTCMDVYEPF
ncbi:MAG TPA: helix-turn-helix domain-containing protein [Buttiauxella sp.]